MNSIKNSPELSEIEKALSGELYNATDKELIKMRMLCKDLCFEYNSIKPSNLKERVRILNKIFNSIGSNPVIEQPFYCDYGKNISSGDNLFINHNCVILDCANVTIGNNVFIAPNCGFYTAGHPLEYSVRNTGLEYAKPITIGDNVWIGANTAVLGGVCIGSGSVIGAGSVVKNDIPPNVLAFGNPCKVIKNINNT